MSYAPQPERAYEALASLVRGPMIYPGDPAYDETRSVFNGMIDRRPAAIVRCAGAADVLACVRYARDNGIRVSIRCGGHSVPGHAVCDGGLMIDLSACRTVHVDAGRRIARAAGGATWGDFDHETHVFGLATTGGLVRSTGIAGLTLAGGHGFLVRKYGLACDNLLSADVVTADGRLLKASAEENADLFWGLRGGGGNFGIVTSFEYRLHPVNTVYGGVLIYPFEHARKLLKAYDEFARTAPDELGLLAVLGTLPDGTKMVAILASYCGSTAEGERLLAPLRNLAPLIADQVAAMPYPALQSIVENFNPRGMRNYWKTSYLSDLGDDLIGIMIDHHRRTPSPYTHQVVYTLGGAVSRVADGDTAVSHRQARHAYISIGMWEDAASDDAAIAFVRGLAAAVQPHSTGGFYPNYEADAAGQMKAAFGAEKYAKLVALKRKYDPDNFFRLNQNIRPDA